MNLVNSTPNRPLSKADRSSTPSGETEKPNSIDLDTREAQDTLRDGVYALMFPSPING